MKSVIEKIEQEKVIAIIRGVASENIIDVANALYQGGISLVEVTFNQSNPNSFVETCKAIQMISQKCPQMIVGAGTVLTKKQVKLAKNAGAKFIISPDTDKKVIKYCVKNGLVSIPGAYTASEAKKAHEYGAHFVKLFPCMDKNYLKAIKAPLSHIKFLAVGGVNQNNAVDFIKAGAVGVGVGSCLVNKELVGKGDFAEITKTAKELVDNIKGE